MLKLLSIARFAVTLIRKPTEQVNNLVDGKKTFLAGAALVVYGILGVCLGKIDLDTAVKMIANGTGWIGLRHALLKKDHKEEDGGGDALAPNLADEPSGPPNLDYFGGRVFENATGRSPT